MNKERLIDQLENQNRFISGHQASLVKSAIGELKQNNIICNGVAKKLEWLSKFYESSSLDDTPKDMQPLIVGIQNLFLEKKYDIVNAILLEMDITKLSHIAMLSIITTTFPARNKLTAWSNTTERVRLKLNEDGRNANSIMAGLI